MNKVMIKNQIKEVTTRDSSMQVLERLLKLKGVDWNGNTLGVCPYISSAVPQIPKTSHIYKLLIEEAEITREMIKAADFKVIQNILNRLRLHFPVYRISESEIGILMEDYLEDLSVYPEDIIEQTCLEYRQNAENKFFPKIGQLLKLANSMMLKRKLRLMQLQKLIEASV